MNLADYLSELLEQQDEVSVPGLGRFVRVHVNGCYNDAEARFHPPYHQVKFTPDPKDDDIFTQYVAEKKNISLASSKYFAEKFVGNLNEQASKGNYLFADLGLFKNEQGRLVFKPNDRISPDPSFYGLPIVSLHKIGAEQTSYFDEPKAVATEAADPVATPMPAHEEYYEDELAAKKPVSIWIIMLVVIGVLVAGIFGIHKFYPAAFNKIGSAYHNLANNNKNKAKAPVAKVVKRDTAKKKPVVVEDSIAKIVAPPVDSIPHDDFEVIIGSARDPQKANILIANFAKRGINAKVVLGLPGRRVKISAGGFPDKEQAENERLELAKTGKIPKANSYILPIKAK